jgi:hypothetical protein
LCQVAPGQEQAFTDRRRPQVASASNQPARAKPPSGSRSGLQRLARAQGCRIRLSAWDEFSAQGAADVIHRWLPTTKDRDIDTLLPLA